MSKIITDDQKHEIEDLIADGHAGALIAYGAEMYNDGIIKGEVICILMTALGFAIGKIVNKVYNKK